MVSMMQNAVVTRPKLPRCPTCGGILFPERYLRAYAVRCLLCPYRVERFRRPAPTPKPAQQPSYWDDRICAGCGVSYTPNSGVQKYCTQGCGKRARTRLLVAVCENCGNELPGVTVRKRYCNDKCGALARQRAAKMLSN